MNEKGIQNGYESDVFKAFNERNYEQAYKDSYQAYVEERANRNYTACPPTEVKTKQIKQEELERKIKTAAYITGGALALGFITVIGMDVICHPEDYFTTFENFAGGATFAETWARTGENVNELIEAAGSVIKGGR